MKKYNYLKTEKWKKLRKKLIYDRKNVKCCACGYNKDKTKLVLHHKNYNFVYKEIKADLIILCWWCHNFLHEYHKKFGYLEKIPFWYLQKMKIGKKRDGKV